MGGGSPPQGVATTTNAAGRGSGPHCPPAAGSSPEVPPLSFSVWTVADATCSSASAPAGCSRRAGRCSCCSPAAATRSACSTSPSGSPGAAHVTALHCNYGLRDAAGADAASLRRLCERLGVRLHVRRPRSARGAGNLQAWARDARYAGGAASSRAAATSPPATPRPTRSRPCSTGSPPRPAAARCSGWPRATGGSSGRCSAVTREETAAHCRRAGWPGARTPATPRPTFARNRVRHELLPALRSLHPAAEANVLRTLALLRDEAAVLDAIVDDALAGAGDPPRARGAARAAARAAPARGAAARRQPPPGGPARRSGTAPPRCSRSREGGALDVGGGLRAEIRGGALLFGASHGPAAPRPDRARP